jgi:hypothetical protein
VVAFVVACRFTATNTAVRQPIELISREDCVHGEGGVEKREAITNGESR